MIPKPARLARNVGKQYTGPKSAKLTFIRERHRDEDEYMEDEVLYQDDAAPDGCASHGATRFSGAGGVIRSFGEYALALNRVPADSVMPGMPRGSH
jgi:hypothetical protein